MDTGGEGANRREDLPTGMSVSLVACRHGTGSNQIFTPRLALVLGAPLAAAASQPESGARVRVPRTGSASARPASAFRQEGMTSNFSARPSPAPQA